MSATISAESRSQPIMRRRGGTRSTRLESSAPLNRYGTKASVKVKPARNDEPLRSKTSTVSATAATMSPSMETV